MSAYQNGWVISLIASPYTVTSYALTQYDSTGDLLEGSSSQQTVMGSLQPVSGAVIEQVPEGLRARASAMFYTTASLNIARQGDFGASNIGNRGDLISHFVDTYEVISEARWSGVGGHNAYVLERVIS